MANRKFNEVPTKATIVPADEVVLVDSEDSLKLKRVSATVFKGADGAQGPQGEPGVVVDATTLVKGVIQLSGDLGGTASSPTVPGLATKQDTLVSGTNIKTVNGENILGSGNLEVSAGSGGYAANVYLQSTASSTVPAYKALSYVPEPGTSTITAVANNNEVLLGTFIYDADVGTTIVDAGEWGFHFHAQVSTSAGDSFLRFEPFKRTSGGIETVLFTTTSPEISNTTPATVSELVTQSAFTVSATDRLGIKVYASTTHNANVTFTVTVGDGNASYFNTPLAIRHSQLRARDATDSHPISAITSLQSTLDAKANLSGATFTGDITVPDEAYDATTWNGNNEVPTKNAIRDKIETLGTKVPRVSSETSSATPTINTDNVDAHSITALATAITSMSTNLTGTPSNFQKLIVRIKDDGTARAITWGASFEAKGVALPTTTVISKVLTVGFIYDSVTSKWGCVASSQES